MAAVSDDTILNWFKINTSLVTCTLSRYYGIMPLPEIVNSSWLMACLPTRQVNRKNKTTNHELRTTNRKSKGFTLIELLVVISIIAILMAVATISYLNAQQKGRDNKRKTDLKAIQQALEIYFNQNGKYPFKQNDTFSNDGRFACANTPNTGVSWGSVFTCGPVTYMNPTPKDPVFAAGGGSEYYYDSPSGNATYTISAKLENSKDPDAKNVNPFGLVCTPQGYTNPTTYTRNYCVINP